MVKLNSAPSLVELDGRTLEGGGQLIRITLCLSALTGVPVKITDIRGNRSGGGGLKAQHLACVNWLAQVCNAKVTGAEKGSKTLTFEPEAKSDRQSSVPPVFKKKTAQDGTKFWEVRLEIGTAGSTGLALQAILPFILFTKLPLSEDNPIPIRLTLSGGTNVSGSPSYDYITGVLLPTLSNIGFPGITATLGKRGWSHGGMSIGNFTLNIPTTRNSSLPLPNFHLIRATSDGSSRSRGDYAGFSIINHPPAVHGACLASGVTASRPAAAAAISLQPSEVSTRHDVPSVRQHSLLSATVIAPAAYHDHFRDRLETAIKIHFSGDDYSAHSSIPVDIVYEDSGNEKRLYLLLVVKASTSAGRSELPARTSTAGGDASGAAVGISGAAEGSGACVSEAGGAIEAAGAGEAIVDRNDTPHSTYYLGRDWLYDRKIQPNSHSKIVADMAGRVVRELHSEWESGAFVDEHLRDQMVIFQALAGGRSEVFPGWQTENDGVGRKKSVGKDEGENDDLDADTDDDADGERALREPSLHARTAEWVCRQMLGVRFDSAGTCEGVEFGAEVKVPAEPKKERTQDAASDSAKDRELVEKLASIRLH